MDWCNRTCRRQTYPKEIFLTNSDFPEPFNFFKEDQGFLISSSPLEAPSSIININIIRKNGGQLSLRPSSACGCRLAAPLWKVWPDAVSSGAPGGGCGLYSDLAFRKMGKHKICTIFTILGVKWNHSSIKGWEKSVLKQFRWKEIMILWNEFQKFNSIAYESFKLPFSSKIQSNSN